MKRFILFFNFDCFQYLNFLAINSLSDKLLLKIIFQIFSFFLI